LATVSPLTILSGFLLLLVRYFANFFEEEAVRNSRSSF
jgi:hypothetical protein